MLLVTYDSDHIDMAGNAKPWGFVNSWVPGGQLLYWMSEDDLNRTLGHPLLTLSNTVLIENVRLDDTIAAGPSLSFAPAPDPSQSLPQTPTSTPTPGESK
jgi:hypothetical protein